MSDRAFPPSARRRRLARAAGLSAASPLLVGALACAAAVLAVVALGRALASSVGGWIAAACAGRATLDAAAVPRALLALALPMLAAAAIVALVAHVAQTRAVWLPRRKLPGAPAPAPHRVRRAALELVGAAVVGGVAVGWLWLVAPRLATLTVTPLAGGLLIASFVATLAIAWTVLGVGDALIRHAELAEALRMTAAEKREDERLSGADPRWRARRGQVARARDGVAGATLLVLGDDVAVAIAWDPARRPVPTRTASGRGARATQLLALARRHAVPVHRDAALAAAIAGGEARVAETHWPRLAEVMAAVVHRGTPVRG